MDKTIYTIIISLSGILIRSILRLELIFNLTTLLHAPLTFHNGSCFTCVYMIYIVTHKHYHDSCLTYIADAF